MYQVDELTVVSKHTKISFAPPELSVESKHTTMSCDRPELQDIEINEMGTYVSSSTRIHRNGSERKDETTLPSDSFVFCMWGEDASRINEMGTAASNSTRIHRNGSERKDESSLPRYSLVWYESDEDNSSRYNEKTTKSQADISSLKKSSIPTPEHQSQKKKEWTDKEMQSRKDILFRFLNNEINYMHRFLSSDQEGREGKEILRQHFEFFFAFYYTIERIGPLPYAVLNKYRREAGQQLSRTKSIGVICKVVIDEWKRCCKREITHAIKPPSQIMLTSLLILCNFSDSSPKVTYDIVRQPYFLTTLKEILTSYFHKRTQGEEMSKDESLMIRTFLSILQNLSTVDENITPLREQGIVAIVSAYLDSKIMLDRFKTLAILANIIDEKESEILQGKDDLLRMFLETLKTALQTPSHCCLVDLEEYSAWECTLTIQHLARNHANKKLLVEMGCLPHLVELAKIGIVAETRVAVGAIWLLAFDKDNKKKIVDEEELNTVDVLFNIKETSKDKETKDRADETLWLLREVLERNEKYKSKVRLYSNWNKVQDDVKGAFANVTTNNRKRHIMISYNRGHRMELIKIKDKLKENGYSVWMDIDDMFGTVAQAMAEAVEFADVVLICMSRAYENSVDCKHEANYAYQLRKTIVPLKMEKDFAPNGWLGLITAGKKFYDFSGKYDFEAKFNDLLKELASQLLIAVPDAKNHKEADDDASTSIPNNSSALPYLPTSLADVRKWRRKNVNNWLQQNNLSKTKFGHLTGRGIAALVRMKDQAPEYFYRYLKKELQIKMLSTIDTFINALDNL